MEAHQGDIPYKPHLAPLAHKRVRIWLDSSWLLGVIKREDLRLVDDLKRVCAALHMRGYQPELAVSTTVLDEVTSIPNPNLLKTHMLNHEFFSKRHAHESTQLAAGVVGRVEDLRGILRDMHGFITGLSAQEGAAAPAAPERSPIVFVHTNRCKKNEYLVSENMQRQARRYDLPLVKQLGRMKAEHPAFHVPPENAEIVQACAEAFSIQKYIAEAGHNPAFDFCAFEDISRPVLMSDRHIQYRPVDPLFTDPVFHITSRDWLKERYLNLENRGEFSIQSGVKSSNRKFQVIMTNDSIERNDNFEEWLNNAKRAKVAIGIIPTKTTAAVLSALEQDNYQPLEIWQRDDLIDFCKGIAEPGYKPPARPPRLPPASQRHRHGWTHDRH